MKLLGLWSRIKPKRYWLDIVVTQQFFNAYALCDVSLYDQSSGMYAFYYSGVIVDLQVGYFVLDDDKVYYEDFEDTTIADIRYECAPLDSDKFFDSLASKYFLGVDPCDYSLESVALMKSKGIIEVIGSKDAKNAYSTWSATIASPFVKDVTKPY